MIMSVQKYKKLYQIEAEAINYLNDDVLKKFVLQGSKNWDLYFTKKNDNDDFDTLDSIEVIEFKTQKDMLKYMKTISKKLFIDYSIEDNKFYVVNYEKN